MCTHTHDTLIEENCLSQVQLNAIARCPPFMKIVIMAKMVAALHLFLD